MQTEISSLFGDSSFEVCRVKDAASSPRLEDVETVLCAGQV